MSRAYITLWSRPQLELARGAVAGGATLSHAANAQFRARGVAPGDRVYVVATEHGRLLLLGRLDVERVVGQTEAERHFEEQVYEAPDHLVGTGTELRLDRVVPEHIAREIERESGKRLAIAPREYQVDVTSLRATGRITERSAALLDALLDGVIPIDSNNPSVLEGGRQEARHRRIERSAVVRARALECHGTNCSVCGFSFAEVYGPLGEGFAEVHHLTPLANLTERVLVDPVKDAVVLCANCHRMVHRRCPPLSPDELRQAMPEGSASVA